MNKKVMIIDDDKELLSELKESLAANGYDITTVDNTQSAVEMAFQSQPDVILVDLKMPGKSGFELANEMKRMPRLDNASVIAMSAFFREDFRSLLNLCGITKCIKKPFSVSDVISAIEDKVNKK